MQQLWAPWRMAYINESIKTSDQHDDCIFCTKPAADPSNDENNLIIYRSETSFIMMNLFPYNSGHLLIAPYQHTGSIADLPLATITEVMLLAQKCETALHAALQPDGFNIGMNLGKVAGAGYPNHLHLHIVPRWNGDTNFMPVLADIKVMPEFMEQTYAKIKLALLPLL